MIKVEECSREIIVSVYGEISKAVRSYDAVDSVLKIYHVPRGNQKEFRNLIGQKTKSEALYFLVGDSDEMCVPEIYIGQTDDVVARLKNHDSLNNFDWRLAICAVPSKTLGKNCLKSLEKAAIERASKNCILVNEYENKSYRPLTAAGSIGTLISNISDYLTIMGYPILIEVEKEKNKSLYISQNGKILAEGEYLIDKFVVFEGSMVRFNNVGSMTKNNRDLKERLIKNRILVSDGEYYRFTKDYAFSSPSAAACIILGANVSGWQHWKDKDGNNLNDLFDFE